MSRRNGIEDVWRKVSVNGPDECWPWVGSVSAAGYGVFGVNRRLVYAHRAAFEHANGRPPAGEVMHACDNPRCCNPAHLREGTHLENMADMRHKGRSLTGERSPHCQFPWDMIVRLRENYASGRESIRELARQYGISHQHASDVIRGAKRRDA